MYIYIYIFTISIKVISVTRCKLFPIISSQQAEIRVNKIDLNTSASPCLSRRCEQYIFRNLECTNTLVLGRQLLLRD